MHHQNEITSQKVQCAADMNTLYQLLIGFIQDALNLLGEKPLVLSVQKVPITMPRPDSVSTTKDVVFLHNSDDNYHTATIRYTYFYHLHYFSSFVTEFI